ncbi:MAG TPA: DUF6228 family protein [Devosiaceae bacterium]|jgi:hypothetical protein
MGVIHETAATLRFHGDELDPHEVTRLMGASPTRGEYKGALTVGRGRKAARTGGWALTVEYRQPGDLSGQIEEALSGLTQDLDVWRDLSGRFNGCFFVGFFMVDGNEGYNLSAETLKLLADRGLALLLDIYSGRHEDERAGYPLTVLSSPWDGGYFRLRRDGPGRLVVEAGNAYFHGEAECDISWMDSPAGLFAEMASAWRGWDGTKRWSDHEDRLRLSAKTDGLGHVLLDVDLLGADHASRLHVPLILDVEDLEDIAARMRKAVPIDF